MASSIIVGFAPAAAEGAGKGVTGFSPAAGSGERPLGLFATLLGAATAEVPAAEFAVPADAALAAVTTGLLDAPLPAEVEPSLETPVPSQTNGQALFGDLVDALAALDLALANDEAPNPALTKKLAETLDALAGLLGIPLPAEPPASAEFAATADPAATAAMAAAPVPTDLDPLLAQAAEIAPALESGSAITPAPADGTSQSAVASFSVPIVPAALTATADPAPLIAASPASAMASVPAPDPLALPAVTVAAEPLTEAATPPAAAKPEPANAPPPPLARLIEKITDLAQSLQTHSPGLAKRLDALAQKLTSGEISTQTLAEFGIGSDDSVSDEALDQVLQKLLSASSPAKGTPAPQAFAAAALKLPELIALPPKEKAPAPPAPEPTIGATAAPDAEPEDTAEPASRLAFEPRPSGRPDNAAPQPQTHTAPSETPKVAVKPETPAEPVLPPQAAAAAPTAGLAAGAKAIHAAYQAPIQQISIPQVAFEVVRQFQAGNSRFQIRLDPPELGRIDVKLDVDKSGNVNARMTVERPETLDLIQRDQRALERALAQAGLDSSKTNLEFSLRQNPFAREDGGNGRGNGSPFGRGDEASDLPDETPSRISSLYRGSAHAGGVNLFV